MCGCVYVSVLLCVCVLVRSTLVFAVFFIVCTVHLFFRLCVLLVLSVLV